MRLSPDRLEPRTVLSAVYDAGVFHPDAPAPLPGFAGEVRYVYSDVDGNGTLDTVYAGGEGAGCRVRGVSGGSPTEWEPAPDYGWGTPAVQPRGYGDELFDVFAFADTDTRIGLDLAATPGGQLYIAWQAGGGPVVAKARWDHAARQFDAREFLAEGFDLAYRGGLHLETHGEDLLILPREDAPRELRGGPLLSVYPGGELPARTMFVADPESRDPVRFAPALVGFTVDVITNEQGFAVELDRDGDGVYELTNVLTWGGRLVSSTAIGDPGTEWWL